MWKGVAGGAPYLPAAGPPHFARSGAGGGCAPWCGFLCSTLECVISTLIVLTLCKYFLKTRSRCKLHECWLEASASWDTACGAGFGQLRRQGLLSGPYSGPCRSAGPDDPCSGPSPQPAPRSYRGGPAGVLLTGGGLGPCKEN